MKVGFLVDNFPALSQTFVVSQIIGLIDRGVDVRIFSLAESKQPLSHGVVERYNLMGRVDFFGHRGERAPLPAAAMRLLRRIVVRGDVAALRSLNAAKLGRRALTLRAFALYEALAGSGLTECDAVIAHFGPMGVIGAELKAMGVIRGGLAVVFHGYDVTRYVNTRGNDVYARLFRDADLVLPISRRWEQALIRLGCPPAKISVHHMGVDPERFHYKVRRLNPSGPVRLLSVARLVEKKGIEFGIRSVANLVATHGVAATYRIAGDGALREPLERLAEDLGLNDVVQFLGWQTSDQIAEEMAEADMLLLPSVTAADNDQEGIPVTLMEAMSMGLPVVATRHSGIPELVEDGISGYLVDERDAAGMAAAIHRILTDAASVARMTCEARKVVEQHFNNARLDDSLLGLLSSIATRPSGR